MPKIRLRRPSGASPKSPISTPVPHPGSAPAERRASLAQRQATPADAERLRTACSKAVGVSNACAANDKRDAHAQAQARRGQSVLPLADFLWFSNSITAGSVIRKGQA